MTSIFFFPWLKAHKTIDYGSVLLEPYERGQLPGNQEYTTQADIDEVMNYYRISPTKSVQNCLLLRPQERKIGEDLNDDEKGFLQVFGEILCFSYIAERVYFGQDFCYCCKEDFELHGQRWTSDKFDGYIVIPSRKRDGIAYNFTDYEHSVYYRPHNANRGSHLQEYPPLTQPLLQASQIMDGDQWRDIFECIINYNLANTDNALIAPETEMVLLHSAFDAIFRKFKKDNPEKRAELYQSYKGSALLGVDEFEADSCLAKQFVERNNKKPRSLVEHWFNDFKLARGHHAHGGTNRDYPGLWSKSNHLVLGSFVLPLLVKKRLESFEFYSWSHEDQANIAAFEKLIQYDHLSDRWCGDVAARRDHPWNRILQAAKKEADKKELRNIIYQELKKSDNK